MTVTKTICQSCYFYCGLDVTHDGDQIERIDGSPEHPVNRGTICPKGLAAQQLVTHPKRLTRPLFRDRKKPGDSWTELSWDDALDLLAEKLRAARSAGRPESVVYHRGHAPGWVTTYNYVTRFMTAFGSPNLVTHAHLCFAPRAIAHLATYGGVPEPDFDHARCIVLWGFNPVYTSLPNYARRIIESKERGAKLIVVDPRYTQTAAKADLWLQPRPGTDLPLALGIVKTLIEEQLLDREYVREHAIGLDVLTEHVGAIAYETIASTTGVPIDRMKAAAQMMAENRPTTVKEGNGLDQHVNVTQTVRAVALIPTLLGSLNIEGGNVLLPPLPFHDVQLRGLRGEDWEERSLSRHPLYYRTGNALHDEDLLAALEDDAPYPIDVLIVQGGALLAANSNVRRTERLLEKVGFLAVHDLFMTATAERADLVLPAASFLERDLLLYYRYRPSAQSNMIALQQQVVSPAGESRSDLELIFDLARRIGLHDHFPWGSVGEAFDWELEPVGIDLEYLKSHPEGYQRDYAPDELYVTDGRSGFSTESGKIELAASRLEAFGSDALPQLRELPAALEPSDDYPLLCGTGLKLGIHTHTEFHSLPWIEPIEPAPFAEIHPEAAAASGIRDRDRVRVESPWGAVEAIARITRTVDEEVVMLSYGYGQPYAGAGWQLSNCLTPDGTIAADPDSGATSNRRVPVRLIRTTTVGEQRSQRLLIAKTVRCVGCHTCEVACRQEHGEARIRIHEVGPVRTEDGEMRSLSLPIGCDSCDLCAERTAQGAEPACVVACPTNALSLVEPATILQEGSEGVHVCAVRDVA